MNKEIELYKQVKAKIDYNKVNALTGFKPHSKQKDILNTAQQGDFNVMVCLLPRRFGKSTIMSQISFAELLCPFSSVLLITPKFQNARAIFDMVEKLVNEQGLPLKTRDSKGLTFTLENGATFMVVSQKNYENALGQKFSLVVVDETGSINGIKEIWETYISPAQNDYGLTDKGFMWSKTFFIGTARSYDTDFYALYEKAKHKEKGYELVTATIYDNVLLPKKFIETIKAKVDKKTWEQEYLCIWQNSGNGEVVYYAFEETKHTISHTEALKRIDKENKFIVGLDWGHTDNTSLVIGAVLPFTGEIIILDEYAENKLPLSIHKNNFEIVEGKYLPKEKVNLSNTLFRYGDPSGKQVMTDLAYNHHYYVTPAPTELEEAIRNINNLFSENKLFISDNCVKLIKELKTMQWKDKNSKTINRNSGGHFDLALGSFRYCVYGWLANQGLKIQSLELEAPDYNGNKYFI